jgi:hypothetical protein
MRLSRRDLLRAAAIGAGGFALRAAAGALPFGLSAAPSRAAADDCSATAPQRIILITSSAGDPVNANVPGCYVSGIYHPPALATGTITWASASSTAAKPWADLPAPVLARTCFFHHGTYTSAHGDHAKVLSLMGAIKRQEQLFSLLARAIAPCLGCTQPQPVVLSPNLITFQGAVQPVLQPAGLARILAAPTGTGTALRARRDADLGAIAALLKTSATTAQAQALDRYALSQQQARAVPADLVAGLASTADKTDQARLNTAAAVLLAMNVTPVIVMSYDFGGDNHSDAKLAAEAAATTASVASLADLHAKLTARGLQDKVTIVLQHVFGRTLNAANRGGNTDGRDHNPGHHCSVLIGKGFKGGVVGGVTPAGNDFRAQAIASATGAADAAGDVPYEATLAAMGKTLGAAVGVDRAVLDGQIAAGKVVEGALAP